MMIWTNWGNSIEVINQVPPPIAERAETYLVLRRDGDEWGLAGEVITPAVMQVLPERWFGTLREAYEAIQRIADMYGVRQIYVVEGQIDELLQLLH